MAQTRKISIEPSMHSCTIILAAWFPCWRLKINAGKPGEELDQVLEDLADHLSRPEKFPEIDAKSVLAQLSYHSPSAALKNALLFREKFWQLRIYPKLGIDHALCIGCGACARVCAVQCLEMGAGFPILSGRWPRKSNFRVDWALVRKTAIAGSEPLPLRINFLTVARGALPSWGVAAGDFSGQYRIDFPSFQIVYADKTGIIEAPFDQRLFAKFPYGTDYNQEAYEIMLKAMLQAAFIIPTHEHWDHLGGIAQSPHLNQILSKTILTKKQINGPTIRDAEFPARALEKYKPFDYEKYGRVAPGVVLIEAPGHSVGHQMIYVQLQNGREYLFTGDIVWVRANLDKKKARPRLANIKRKENRKQIAHQMKWLRDTFYDHPANEIIMVTTHDPEQHEQYIKEGFLGDGFEIRPAALVRIDEESQFE